MKLVTILFILLSLAVGFILGSYFGKDFSKKTTIPVESSSSNSNSSEKPSEAEIEKAVQAKLFEFYEFKLDEFDITKQGNNSYQINFKGRLIAKEDLYVLGDLKAEYAKYKISSYGASLKSIDGTPLRFLSPVASQGGEKEVYGRCHAEKYVDRWSVECEGFEDSKKIVGVPLSTFPRKDYVIEGTPEAKAAFERLANIAHDKEKRLQNHLKSIMPYVKAGTIYEGTIYPSDSSKSPQKIRITFNEVREDGSLVTATASNPEDDKEWVSLRGAISSHYVNDMVTPENDPERRLYLAHPLVLRTDPSHGSYRDRKESFSFYVVHGYSFWLGIEEGKLVGKIGRDPNQIHYSFTAAQKP